MAEITYRQFQLFQGSHYFFSASVFDPIQKGKALGTRLSQRTHQRIQKQNARARARARARGASARGSVLVASISLRKTRAHFSQKLSHVAHIRIKLVQRGLNILLATRWVRIYAQWAIKRMLSIDMFVRRSPVLNLAGKRVRQKRRAKSLKKLLTYGDPCQVGHQTAC